MRIKVVNSEISLYMYSYFEINCIIGEILCFIYDLMFRCID